jgi:hypothetical protein
MAQSFPSMPHGTDMLYMLCACPQRAALEQHFVKMNLHVVFLKLFASKNARHTLRLQVTFKKSEPTKRRQKANKKIENEKNKKCVTAPSIPTSSPTVVLTGLSPA